MSKDQLLVNLGLRIRMLRKRLNYSQEKLAELAGVKRPYIARVEQGQSNISLKTLQKISIALGITLVELMVGIDTNDTSE